MVVDMAGTEFGMLRVIDRAPKPEDRRSGAYWWCECQCGAVKAILGAALRSGHHKSCGCAKHAWPTGRKRGPRAPVVVIPARPDLAERLASGEFNESRPVAVLLQSMLRMNA